MARRNRTPTRIAPRNRVLPIRATGLAQVRQSDLEVPDVVSLIRSQSHAPTRGADRSSNQLTRLRNQSIRAQPVAVLHKDMAPT